MTGLRINAIAQDDDIEHNVTPYFFDEAIFDFHQPTLTIGQSASNTELLQLNGFIFGHKPPGRERPQ